jgi:hypothetical protein
MKNATSVIHTVVPKQLVRTWLAVTGGKSSDGLATGVTRVICGSGGEGVAGWLL